MFLNNTHFRYAMFHKAVSLLVILPLSFRKFMQQNFSSTFISCLIIFANLTYFLSSYDIYQSICKNTLLYLYFLPFVVLLFSFIASFFLLFLSSSVDFSQKNSFNQLVQIGLQITYRNRAEDTPSYVVFEY